MQFVKFLFFTFLALFYAHLSTAQYTKPPETSNETKALTIGILNGGGGIIGADYEFLLGSRFGMQLGIGLVSFGGGFTYHFKPGIRTSAISLQYYHQGIGNSFVQNSLGPVFIYRSKKWFTAQLGWGVPLSRGPALPADYTQPPFMLLYSIGGYITSE